MCVVVGCSEDIDVDFKLVDADRVQHWHSKATPLFQLVYISTYHICLLTSRARIVPNH